MKTVYFHLLHRVVLLALLVVPGLASAQTILLPRGSAWKCDNSSVDLGAAWRLPGYDDSLWEVGPGPLGSNVQHGVQYCASVIDIGPAAARYPVVYFRTAFNVSSASNFPALVLRLNRDPSAVVYLNGTLLTNVGVPQPVTFAYTGGPDLAAGDTTNYVQYVVPGSALVNNANLLAVEVHQAAATSPGLQFDLELVGATDNTPPLVAAIDPKPPQVLPGLSQVNVFFNKAVVGVQASSLLINGISANRVVSNAPIDYTFFFPQQTAASVLVAWAANQAITDTTLLSNRFAGGSWSYTLETNFLAQIVLSEFLANNSTNIQDEDGSHSPWIELLNRSSGQAVMDGWFLTDTPTDLTKWRFPTGMAPLQAGAYLMVWASAKNRINPSAPLHTNFKLSQGPGGYLALLDPQTNLVSVFDSYPLQSVDVSYGRDAVDPNIVGYFSPPTPGKPNTGRGAGFVPEPNFSVDTGLYTNDTLRLTLWLSNAPAGSTIRYTLNGSLPAATSPLYTAPITFGTNMMIKVRAFPPAGNSLFPSAVVAKSYIFLDSSDKDFNSNLPLMIISTQGQGIPQNVPPGGTRLEGTIAVIDTYRGRSSLRGTPEFMGMAGLELYGQTSIGFPKPPVRIELHDALFNSLNVPLLGLPAESDWKLRNPYDDKTMMNDFLGYELFEKMGNYACRRRLVEIFIDTGGGRLHYPDDYVGVEVLLETIKVGAHRVNIPSLTPYDTNEPSITGGYIFKKDKDSEGDINFSTAGNAALGFPAEVLKFHEPKVNSMRTSPVSTAPISPWGQSLVTYLTGYLNQMEKALYAANWTNLNLLGTTNHYSYYMDVDAFVEQHWLVEFTKQIDGYRLSDYFTKDRLGKVKPSPTWDWNLSFGNGNYLRGGQTNGWYYSEQDQGMTANEHLWQRRLINGAANLGGGLPDGSGNAPSGVGDPDYTQKIADRWSVLRTNVLNGTNLLQRIDEISTLLSEAATRDLWGKWRAGVVGQYVWPNPNGSGDGRDVDYVRPTNYLGGNSNSIIWQMKKFVLGRYLWIDAQFTPVPLFNRPGGPISRPVNLALTTAPGQTNWYTLDGTDPRGLGGGLSPRALAYTGPIQINNSALVFARARGTNSWLNTWSGPAKVALYTALPPLRITEIMYDPAAPPSFSTNLASDFAFVEVKNTGATALDVSRFSLAGDVQFQCTNRVLAAGQSAVVVANPAAFQSRYGSNILILGTYTGSLLSQADPPRRQPDALSGHLILLGPLQEIIHDFYYFNSWYPATEGFGFSLVVADESAPASAWGSASQWRPSSAAGGSPGQNDPAPPPRPGVLVNEVLSSPSGAANDAVELYNPTSSPADISGWFLAGSFRITKKYVLPSLAIIPPGGYVVLDASTSFGANGTNSFGLSAAGDKVYLFSADGVNLTGYAHGFTFGASDKNVAFGRYVTSTGAEQFVAQATNTLGGANAGPLVGPVVISEINYHPPDSMNNGLGADNFDDEYVELQNITGTDQALYDLAYPTNTWQLSNAVSYAFPTNVSVPAWGFLLVVGFDPAADPAATAAFRARNYVPAEVPLFGPWRTNLANGGASLELSKPGAPPGGGLPTPYILVDQVEYSNQAPWPGGADGFGLTLQRIVPAAYGNDPTNWVAVGSSPGANYIPGIAPPAIVSQPGDQVLATGRGAALTVVATGVAPVRYQWRMNGWNLPGATNATLTFSSTDATNSGVYSVLVYNGGGSALATNFTLTTRVGLRILTPPQDVFLTVGKSITFTVLVEGTGLLRYQWKLNGLDISPATNRSYTVASAQTTNAGAYTVRLWDDYDTLESSPANLTLIYRPVFVQQPLNRTVPVGDAVEFTVVSGGTPPIGFRWRRNGISLLPGVVQNASMTFTATSSVYALTGAQLTNAGNYTVVASNITLISTLSGSAYLMVVAPPTNQVVQPGSNVTLRAIVGQPNLFTNRYAWLFNDTIVAAGTNTGTSTLILFTNDLVLTNFGQAQQGLYTFVVSNSVMVTNRVVDTNSVPPVTNQVVVTNQISAPGAFTAFIQLASPDSDGDGLPDWWEIQYGLNPHDPTDAAQDADGDGMTNLQEYLAGTNPQDPNSRLRLDIKDTVPSLQFNAVSNRSYTVLSTDGLSPVQWKKLADVLARSVSRLETLVDTNTGSNRFYRLVIPQP